ncbi:Nucleotide-binding, alpha-beta plait domain-containing protein [Strongyloides ratti]|uniref:Nucleotide-binding, alpha-beta plait domain-containing protein n=1 Tax=Strongyloides ratti TaxID=34506 RepID=A0A090LD17_STRRB|nr:Nucleotide-binding, alpha-beta plait domain-containing protein [Strongyloides ratti]CEF67647.1 Nucleotide-binding, alpha-beta plait domain-containing protein [Strongyloides ratti]
MIGYKMSHQSKYFTQLVIRNICKDVTVKDIADLFRNYHYKKFSFEYDNNGKFTGCLVLHCTNHVSDQIKRDFAGCCIDGKLLSFETIYYPNDIDSELIKANILKMPNKIVSNIYFKIKYVLTPLVFKFFFYI